MLERPHERVATPWRKTLGVVALVALACLFNGTQASAQTSQSQSQAGASVASTPRPDGGLPPDYALGSGDHVRITVFGQQELTGEYRVDGSGELAFPLIGRIHAGGMTADQLSRAIEAKLSPDYLKNPHVSSEVLTYRPFYIVGEVKTPGSYTYRAREDSFYVTRNGSSGGKSKIDADPSTPVLPGDIITVRERYF
jgi:protein involved in polysaccharide export with SLBB domain